MLTELLGFMTEVRFADAESLVALRKLCKSEYGSEREV